MFVADLHNDLVQRVIEGEDVTKLTSHGHTDIPRLLKSEIDLEILIIWVSSNAKEPNFFKRADKMYDEIERISSHEEIVIPKKLSDINEAIEKNYNVIILDDGYQDLSIKKNLNIVCFHSSQKIGNGQTIPSGPLRESLKSLRNYF